MYVATLITSDYDETGITFDQLREFVEIVQRDFAGQYWPHSRVIIRADGDDLHQLAIAHDPTRGIGSM